MAGSIAAIPSYYNLLSPAKASKSSSSPVLDAISSAVEASNIDAAAKPSKSEIKSLKLSPEVNALLAQLSGSSSDGLVSSLYGGSSENPILNAASKAAMKQAYALISRSAYQGAAAKSSSETIAATPMNNVIDSYHKAKSGQPPATSVDTDV